MTVVLLAVLPSNHNWVVKFRGFIHECLLSLTVKNIELASEYQTRLGTILYIFFFHNNLNKARNFFHALQHNTLKKFQGALTKLYRALKDAGAPKMSGTDQIHTIIMGT